MPLYGITHDISGEPSARLARILKVGIGYPKGRAVHVYIDLAGKWAIEVGADKERRIDRYETRGAAEDAYRKAATSAPDRPHPDKFGYFTFLRVGADGSYWPDFDAIEAHGPLPTEVPIVFLDNEPLQQRMESWTASALQCYGDGRDAWRRLPVMPEKGTKPAGRAQLDASGQFSRLDHQCYACGCQWARGDKPTCKPHTRLLFQLEKSPMLGGTCSFDSTGFRSASQLYAALQQIREITGRGSAESGVVAGIPLTLKVQPYRTSHAGKASTQYGVTVVLRPADAVSVVRGAISAADTYRATLSSAPAQLAAPDAEDVEIVDADELDPESEQAPAEPATDPAATAPDATSSASPEPLAEGEIVNVHGVKVGDGDVGF